MWICYSVQNAEIESKYFLSSLQAFEYTSFRGYGLPDNFVCLKIFASSSGGSSNFVGILKQTRTQKCVIRCSWKCPKGKGITTALLLWNYKVQRKKTTQLKSHDDWLGGQQ